MAPAAVRRNSCRQLIPLSSVNTDPEWRRNQNAIVQVYNGENDLKIRLFTFGL